MARPQQSFVVKILALTGLRWGEMAALKVRDIDLQRRRIQVSEVAEVRGQLVWSTPKGHERRSVPFPKFIAAAMASQIADKTRDDLVFTSNQVTMP